MSDPVEVGLARVVARLAPDLGTALAHVARGCLRRIASAHRGLAAPGEAPAFDAYAAWVEARAVHGLAVCEHTTTDRGTIVDVRPSATTFDGTANEVYEIKPVTWKPQIISRWLALGQELDGYVALLEQTPGGVWVKGTRAYPAIAVFAQPFVGNPSQYLKTSFYPNVPGHEAPLRRSKRPMTGRAPSYSRSSRSASRCWSSSRVAPR